MSDVDERGRDDPPDTADPARWMPPDPATPGAPPETRVLPTIGGAPGGGVVPADPVPAPDPSAPTAGDGADVAAEAAAPARKRRGLLPRKRSRADAAGPPAAPAADTPAPGAPPADAAPTESRPDPPPVATGEEILDPKGRPASPAALRRERRAIIERRQAAVYHLGGLAFELYRRDMLDEEVMRLRARRLAEMDERVRRIDDVLGDRVRSRHRRGEALAAGPAGCCLACRAPFDDGARFCSNCGTRLLPPEQPMDDEQPTGPIAGDAAA